MWAQPLAVNAKALTYVSGGSGAEPGCVYALLSSDFLALLFSINLSKGAKRHFYKRRASIFQYADDGFLVLIICCILLWDDGLSQVAAYMPTALCRYLDALS